jgi:hypothetical protein
MNKYLEKKFDEVLTKTELEEKDKIFFKKVYKIMDVGYHDYIQPILIAIATFWIFDKVAIKFGNERAFFIMGITIILYLRTLNKSINKLIG